MSCIWPALNKQTRTDRLQKVACASLRGYVQGLHSDLPGMATVALTVVVEALCEQTQLAKRSRLC